MLFNSDLFLQFFAAFLLLYYLVRHHLQARNALIVVASYIFYGCWNWRFLGLLILTSLLGYAVGLGLEHAKFASHRKAVLALIIVANLSVIGLFNYYDFYMISLLTLLS